MKNSTVKILCLLLWSVNSFAGINKQQFNSVLQEFKQVYGAEFRAAGYRLQINDKWNENKQLASIKVPKNIAVLTISGGYARQPFVTADVLRMVLCHEAGHVLGGAPRKDSWSWASVEGQADYFATAKCMKKLIPIEDNQRERVLQAALACGKMLAEGSDTDPQSLVLFHDEQRRVARTDTLHPDPQCRIDTMVAGLLCPISERINFSKNDPDVGACLHRSLDPLERRGARPRCWYRPTTPKYRCVSNMKLPFYNSQMPVITLFQENYRNDNSWEIKLMVGVTPPKDYLVTRIIDGEATTQLRYTKQGEKHYKLELSKEAFNQYKKRSVLPVKWEQLVLNADAQGNYLFDMTCTPL